MERLVIVMTDDDDLDDTNLKQHVSKYNLISKHFRVDMGGQV